MSVLFVRAAPPTPPAVVDIESATWTDVPDMDVTTTAAGTWAILFSAVLQPSEACNVEFRFMADGGVVNNSTRGLKIGIIGPKTERCFCLEGHSAPGDNKVIKVQWRTTYGRAFIGDRRLMLLQ